MSALRSTNGILTIRLIKDFFQWHFGVAACCLFKPGSGGDTCTFFARMSPLPADSLIQVHLAEGFPVVGEEVRFSRLHKDK